MNLHSQVILLGLICFAFLYSCSKEESNTSSPKSSPKKGIVNAYLTDSRGDFKAVYVDVEAVDILWSDGKKGGWSSLDNFTPAIYELLSLSHAKDLLLGNLELEDSRINQIRLTLGLRNFVVFKDNDSVAMTTIPGPDQVGLNLYVIDSVYKGDTLNLIIDFDAGKSVVKIGDPRKFKIKPSLRIIDEFNSGSLKGNISSSEISISIIATKGVDSIGTYTNEKGDFIIRGLESGTYDLLIDPGQLSSFNDTILSSYTVTNQFVLDIGTIKLK